MREITLGRLRGFVLRKSTKSRVILFGSVARGNYRVDSDIDVLIITEKGKTIWDKAQISSKIKEKIGFGDPLELHVVTRKEYEEWYKRFIDVYEEF